jgi:hypothetical protein
MTIKLKIKGIRELLRTSWGRDGVQVEVANKRRQKGKCREIKGQYLKLPGVISEEVLSRPTTGAKNVPLLSF